MHACVKVLSSSSSCQQLSMTSLSEPPPLSQFLSSPLSGHVERYSSCYSETLSEKDLSCQPDDGSEGRKSKNMHHAGQDQRIRPRLESQGICTFMS